MEKTVHCKNCGKEVNARLSKCPECGKRMKIPLWMWIAGTFAALVIIGGVSGGKEPAAAPSQEAPAPVTSSQEEAQPAEQAASVKVKEPGVGDPVIFPDVEYTVTSVKDRGQKLDSGNPYMDPKLADDSRFIQISYQVKNLMKSAFTPYTIRRDLRPVVVDAEGNRYGPLNDSSTFIPEGKKAPDFMNNEYPANLKREFMGLYEVPKEAGVLYFELKPLEDVFSVPVKVKILE